MVPTPTKSRLWRSFVAPNRLQTKKLKQAASAGALAREWPASPDHYELLGQIGKGAAAVVYRARCKLFDTEVAVRKLDLDTSGHTDLAGLVKEATLMRCFEHPAVLPLHAAFVAGRELWMVTPLMGQGSIRGIMMRQFPEGLQEAVIASIMRVVLLGLQYIHKNGGIHRDIKADNILISEGGQVCLGDFGVAATHGLHFALHDDSPADHLRAHTFVGTPCWMAPEVIQQLDDGYGAAADIWSFGITVMELALGKPPLAKMHPMRVVMDTLHKPPPSLEDQPAGRKFSKAMCAVVNACLHKDPAERPTAEQLLHFRFFKQAKGSAFLAQHFLSAVPLPEVTREHTRARLRRAASNKLKELMNPFGSGRRASAWFFPPLDPPEAEQQQQQDSLRQQAHGDQQSPVTEQHTHSNSEDKGAPAAAAVPITAAAAAAATLAGGGGNAGSDAKGKAAGTGADAAEPRKEQELAGQQQLALLWQQESQQQQQQPLQSPFLAAEEQQDQQQRDQQHQQQQQQEPHVVNLLQPCGPFQAGAAGSSSNLQQSKRLPSWLSARKSGDTELSNDSSAPATSGGGDWKNLFAAVRAMRKARQERKAAAAAEVAVFAVRPRITAARSS